MKGIKHKPSTSLYRDNLIAQGNQLVEDLNGWQAHCKEMGYNTLVLRELRLDGVEAVYIKFTEILRCQVTKYNNKRIKGDDDE